MNVRRLAPTFALVATTGWAMAFGPSPAYACPGERTAEVARPPVTACESLEPTLARAALFDAPLVVLDTNRVYRYEGRQLRRIPEGVSVRVRAEPGLTAPLIHRMVACRVDAGPDTRIAVRARGPSFVIELRSGDPEVARALQAEHAPRDSRRALR